MRQPSHHTPDTIWGHEAILKLVGRMIETGRLPHALLLHGPDGVGKRSLAFALAKLIFSQGVEPGPATVSGPAPAPMLWHPVDPVRSDDDFFGAGGDLFGDLGPEPPAEQPPPEHEQEEPQEPPELSLFSEEALAPPPSPSPPSRPATPRALRPIDARIDKLVSKTYPVEYDRDDVPIPAGYIDLSVIEPIGRSKSIRVEQTRTLQDVAGLRPVEADHRIIIVLGADAITQSAANSLLKLIEEPPSYLVLILVTDHSNRVLETIRSRCVSLACQPLEREELTRRLVEDEGVEAGLAAVAAALAEGRPGLALATLSGDLLKQRREIFDARLAIDRLGPAALPLAVHRSLKASDNRVGAAASMLITLARDRMVRRLAPGRDGLLVNHDLAAMLDEGEADVAAIHAEAARLLECLELEDHPAIPAPQPALELALWPA